MFKVSLFKIGEGGRVCRSGWDGGDDVDRPDGDRTCETGDVEIDDDDEEEGDDDEDEWTAARCLVWGTGKGTAGCLVWGAGKGTALTAGRGVSDDDSGRLLLGTGDNDGI